MVTRRAGQQTMTGDPALRHDTTSPEKGFTRRQLFSYLQWALCAVTWLAGDDCAEDNDDEAWDDAEQHLRWKLIWVRSEQGWGPRTWVVTCVTPGVSQCRPEIGHHVSILGSDWLKLINASHAKMLLWYRGRIGDAGDTLTCHHDMGLSLTPTSLAHKTPRQLS